MRERNNVIPFPNTHLEHVNGVPTDLGRMSLQELLQVEKECRGQLEEARTDLYIVRDYIERRFPDGSAS